MDPSSTFYVLDDNGEPVAAKFLYANNGYVTDPNPQTSQIYSKDANGHTQPIANANPNNYLIVPEDYSITDAQSAAETINQEMLQPLGGITGLEQAYADFKDGGPLDLERNYDGLTWNPSNPHMYVPAFQDAGNFNYGLTFEQTNFGGGVGIVAGFIHNEFVGDSNAAVIQDLKSIDAGINLGGALQTSSSAGELNFNFDQSTDTLSASMTIATSSAEITSDSITLSGSLTNDQSFVFDGNEDGGYEIADNGTSDVSLFSYNSSGAYQGQADISGSTVAVQGVVTTLTESNSVVNLGTDATLGLSGVNDEITALGSDVISINGNNNELSPGSGAVLSDGTVYVTGNNDTISVGPDETINLGDFSGDIINGSNDKIVGADGVSASINGGFDTITAGSDATFQISGGSDTVNFSGSSDYAGLLGGTGYSVTGNSDTIDSWANTTLSLSGDSNTLGLGEDNNLSFTGAGNDIGAGTSSYLNGGGGNDTFVLSPDSYLGVLGGTGYNVSANTDTIDSWANTALTVNGNSNTFGLGTVNTLYLTGTSETVGAGEGSSINLGNASNSAVNLGTASYLGITGGSGYQVSANDDTIDSTNDVSVNLDGDYNNLSLGSGNVFSWDGISNTIGAGQGSNLNGSGGSDTVNLGTNSYLGLLSGLGYQISTNDSTVDTETGVSLNLGGSDDIANLGSGSTLGLLGGDDYTVSAPNSNVNTWNDTDFNLNSDDTEVNLGSDSVLGILGVTGDTVDAADGTINTWAGSSFNLAGGTETVNLGTNSYLGLTNGAGFTVNGADSTIDTDGTVSLNADGGSDEINLGGQTDYLGLLGGSGYNVTGTNDTLATTSNTSFNLNGWNNEVNLGGVSNYLGITGGLSNLVNGSQDTVETLPGGSFNLEGNYNNIVTGGANSVLGILSGTGNVANANNGEIQTLSNVQSTFNATNDVINLGADGTFSLNGDHDTLNTSSGTNVSINGTNNILNGSGDTFNVYGSNYGDEVVGSDNSGNNWGLYADNDGFGFDYVDNFDDFAQGYGDKIAAGIDAIARGDSSPFTAVSPGVSGIGVLAGLVSAESSATNSNSASVFETAKWDSKVVTWSFASGSETGFSNTLDAQEQKIVSDAMLAWQKASGVELVEEPSARPTDITIGFSDLDTADTGLLGATDYSGLGGEIMPGAAIRLEDPSQLSFIGGSDSQPTYSSTGATLYQVALHEIGHALGLADSSSPTSAMYYQSTSLNQNLSASDLANIADLYRVPTSPTSYLGSNSSDGETSSFGGDLMAHGSLTQTAAVVSNIFNERGL